MKVEVAIEWYIYTSTRDWIDSISIENGMPVLHVKEDE
jgi:hypothetical protein